MVADFMKKIGFDTDFIDCMDRTSPYFTTDTKTDAFGRGKYFSEEVKKPTIFKKIPRRYKRYGMPMLVFRQLIRQIKTPDIILVTSTMTYWYLGVFEAIKIFRKQFSKAKIMLGGIYATLCEKHALKYSGADTVYPGQINANLLKYLDELGFVPSNRIDSSNIGPAFYLYENLNYGVVITSQGCPFACTYCATRFLCPTFQALPLDRIIEQLDFFEGKTKNIAFFDDALLHNKIFPVLLREIVKRKYPLHFHASNGLHCRYIDENIAQLMFKANFRTAYLSLETTNPRVQKKTGGKVSTKEFIEAVNTFTKIGFSKNSIHVYLLYGMPGQDHEEIIDGIKLCHSLGIHPHLGEFSPIPHTEEFAKTGFDENADPPMHNNLFYTWYYPEPKPDLYRKIKNLLSRKNLPA